LKVWFWKDAGMTGLRMMLVVCVVFFVILTCMNSCWKSDGVEILIIDDFRGDDSHGESMKSMAHAWSLGKCKIVEFQTSGAIPDYLLAVVKAATYAAEHKDKKFVLNVSLGSKLKSRLEEVILKLAESDNILVVAAAGNDGSDQRVYPAAFDGVTAIAASENGVRASYSNYGRHVVLCVPVVARKTVTEKVTSDGRSVLIERSVTIKAGTSDASAKFSGIAALLWTAGPHVDKAEVMKLAKSYCLPMNDREYESGLLGKGDLDDFRVLFAHSATWWTFWTLAAELLLLCLILVTLPGMNKSLGLRIIIASLACVLVSSLPVLAGLPSFLSWGSLSVPLVFLAGLGIIAISSDRFERPLFEALEGERIMLSSDPACAGIAHKVAKRLGKLHAEVSLCSEEMSDMPEGVGLYSHIYEVEDSSVETACRYFIETGGLTELCGDQFHVAGGSFGRPQIIAEKLAGLARGTLPYSLERLRSDERLREERRAEAQRRERERVEQRELQRSLDQERTLEMLRDDPRGSELLDDLGRDLATNDTRVLLTALAYLAGNCEEHELLVELERVHGTRAVDIWRTWLTNDRRI